jgi:hypothetical protein
MRASPKSGLKGPKRSKNGVLVILLENRSNDSSDFLYIVKSVYGLSIITSHLVKKMLASPEFGLEGPKMGL